jgi:hypothetical protein
VRSLLERGAAVHGRDANGAIVNLADGRGRDAARARRRQGFDEMAAMLERAGGRA